MTAQAGHIELERTVDSIIVGRRHREDLGDIDALAASIDREGLLQPPTVTPEGVLVCGRRRLAAIKQLGWKTVNVWVRSGISDRLGQLFAEQDDNMLHKPLTQLEAAALYRELRAVMAEDAARRQAASRFSTDHQPGNDGGGESPPPSDAIGKTREQAARMVTGTASYKRLEQVGWLQQIADDPAQPAGLRAEVVVELERIEAGAAVNPIYQQVREAVTQAAIRAAAERDAELDAMAQEALARVKATAKDKKTKKRPPHPAPVEDAEPTRYPVRAFVLTWTELEDWWTHYDATDLAAALSDEQIEAFLATVEGTVAFADQLRTASTETNDAAEGGSSRGHLRAL